MDSVKIIMKDNEISVIGILNFDTAPAAFNSIKKHFLNTSSLSKNSQAINHLIVLNLEGVTKSDSSALTVLTGVMREASSNNIILQIKNIPKKLLDLIKLSDLASILPIVE